MHGNFLIIRGAHYDSVKTGKGGEKETLIWPLKMATFCLLRLRELRVCGMTERTNMSAEPTLSESPLDVGAISAQASTDPEFAEFNVP